MGAPCPDEAFVERFLPYASTAPCVTVWPIPTHTRSTFLAATDTGQIWPVAARSPVERREMAQLWGLCAVFHVQVFLDITRGAMLAWRLRAHASTQAALAKDPSALHALHALLSELPVETVVEGCRGDVAPTAAAVCDALEDAFSCRAQTPCLPLGHGLAYDTQLGVVTPHMRAGAVYLPRGAVWRAPVTPLRMQVVNELTRRGPVSDDGIARPTLVVTATPKYWASCSAVMLPAGAGKPRLSPEALGSGIVCMHHSILDHTPELLSACAWRLVVLDDAELYLASIPHPLHAARALIVTDALELLPQVAVEEFVCGRTLPTNAERFNMRSRGTVTHPPPDAEPTLQVISAPPSAHALPCGIRVDFVPHFFVMRTLSRIQGPPAFAYEHLRRFARGETECCVCFDDHGDTMTRCGHVLCLACLRVLTARCPMCRAPLRHVYTTNDAYHSGGDAILRAAAGEDTLVLGGSTGAGHALRRFFATRHARNVTVIHRDLLIPPRRRPPLIVFAHAPPAAIRTVAYRRACALSPRVAVLVEGDAPLRPSS